MSETLIKVENVSKKFCRNLKRSLWYGLQDFRSELFSRPHGGDGELRKDEFWAVKDVSFELKRGECLGVIGRNGAGKTTLLRMLNGLIKPDQGCIEMRGRVGALIALGAGFNPILSGRENIYVSASVLGLTRQEIDDKFEEIVEFAELAEFIDMPVQNYSSGMQVRLGFSVATALEPDILILDEILAVGDTAFKMKAYARIGRILQNAAVVFVTHSMTQLYRICDVVGVMDKGIFDIHESVNAAVAKYHMQSGVREYAKAVENNHKCIGHFEYIFSQASNGKSSWCLSITMTADKEMPVELAIINFANQEGLLVAEYRQNFRNSPGIVIRRGGKCEVNIVLSSLPLRSGEYRFDFALYTEGRKLAIVHVSGAGPVRVVNEKLTEAVCALDGELTVSSKPEVHDFDPSTMVKK
ncbi:MAG TPA: ABC transporter ATP-binding protein [Gammaproteobacteria bacterium]